jgi:hypothetical protein
MDWADTNVFPIASRYGTSDNVLEHYDRSNLMEFLHRNLMREQYTSLSNSNLTQQNIEEMNTIDENEISSKDVLEIINDIETNIFKLKQHAELDELQDKINLCKNLIDIIKNKLNDIMFEKIRVNDVVKVEHNERDGYFLILTKKRSEVLKKELDTLKSIQFKIGNDNLIIKTDAFEFRNTSASSTATTTKIFISDVNFVCLQPLLKMKLCVRL